MYNRHKFIKFAQLRAKKHSWAQPEKDYLSTKFVKFAMVPGVLAKLNGFNYALMGGFALGFHGYNRATSDIDILVNATDIPNIIRKLGLTNIRPLTIGGSAGTLIDGTEVDLVAPTWPWVAEGLQKAELTTNGKVLTKPFLVVAKLWAARGASDDMDVLQMIKRMNTAEIKEVKELVAKYLPNDVEDMDQMIEFSAYVH